MEKLWIGIKQLFVQGLLWLALLLALGASLSHVAYSFNQFELAEQQVLGWLAATGVDLGLLALVVGVQRARQQGRGAGATWLALLFVTAISVLANVGHGVRVVTGESLSLSSFASFDIVQTGTMLLLAGCLPVLVFSLSHVAANDTSVALRTVQKETQKLDKKRQKGASTEEKGQFPMPIDETRALRKTASEEAQDDLWQFIADNPDMAGLSYEQVGRAYGRSRQWVSNRVNTWQRAGAIIKDDGVITVLTDERPK